MREEILSRVEKWIEVEISELDIPLEEIIEEDGQAEMTCQFCEKTYHFDKKHLQCLSMIAAAKGL